TAFFEVMAVDPEAFPLGGGLEFVSPSDRRLAALLVDTNVVVTQNLLMALHAQVGDPITVHSAGRSFTGGIAGVLKNAGLFSYQEIMLIAWRGFAALPGGDAMPLGYQTLYADVPGHGASAADLAKRRIQDAIPTARISTTGDASRQNEESVRLVRYFLQIVGLLALFIGGGGVITTMRVWLRRRQTEIAMLKTAGYRRANLCLLFGGEAGLLGLIGGVLGAAGGIGASFLVKGLVEDAFFIPLPAAI